MMLIKLCLIITMLLMYTQASASITRSDRGLLDPVIQINFDEMDLKEKTSVNQQYTSFGVTFSPMVYQSPYPEHNFIGIEGEHIGNFFSLRDGRSIIRFFSIQFETYQSHVAFALVSNAPLTTMTLYNGEKVLASESFETAGNELMNWYSFKSSPFDRIEMDSLGTALVDNIQLTSAVPEPEEWLLVVLAMVLIFIFRKKQLERIPLEVKNR